MSSHIRRRSFLKGGAATGGAIVAASAFDSAGVGAAALGPGRSINRSAVGRRQGSGRLVVVFLRGGQDHLSTVVPYTDADYYDARSTIAIPDDVVLDLDGSFGLHPAMGGLHSLYGQDRLGVVVATGNAAGDRSHFLAQDLCEYGDVAVPADGIGWLARYLNGSGASGASPFRAVSIGNNVAPSLRGYPALGLASIQNFGLGGLTGTTEPMRSTLDLAYLGNGAAEAFGRQALEAVDEVAALSASTDSDPVARGFADLAVLLEADLGVEVATVDIGHWDTHAAMGTPSSGEMAELLAGLDGYLAGFQADLDGRQLGDVTTVVMTEFGRRVAQNGSGGTDHGWGSAAFVMGGAAAGGVFGDWVGLAPADIGPRGDVPVTTDHRDVLGDVVSSVLGADPGAVFPGHTYQPVGVA
ncbi:MAG: DUF1501 domain-containing protein [Microthrixaceae bacterium]